MRALSSRGGESIQTDKQVSASSHDEPTLEVCAKCYEGYRSRLMTREDLKNRQYLTWNF